LSAVYWDLRAGTYSVSLRGEYGGELVDLGQQVLGSPTDDVEFSDNLPYVLYPGVYKLRCTRTSSDTWRDNDALSGIFSGTVWCTVDEWVFYDGTSFPNYVAPAKLAFTTGSISVFVG
jgi:hypothetical protein